MKHDFILTSEQQSLAEEHMWLVDRVIRFAIQPNEYVWRAGPRGSGTRKGVWRSGRLLPRSSPGRINSLLTPSR